MTTPGRPKGEYRSAQHEGTPMSTRRALLVAGLSAGAGAMMGCGMPPQSTSALEIRLADQPTGTPHLFVWNGAPFAVIRPTADMLDDLQAQTVHTWSRRAIPAERPAFFVYALTSPAQGCVLQHAPRGAPRYAPEREWQGGFYDPCRFAEWDYAGRAIKQYDDQQASMRADDLAVPRYELRDGNTLRLLGL
jgi:hypothetical protein